MDAKSNPLSLSLSPSVLHTYTHTHTRISIYVYTITFVCIDAKSGLPCLCENMMHLPYLCENMTHISPYVCVCACVRASVNICVRARACARARARARARERGGCAADEMMARGVVRCQACCVSVRVSKCILLATRMHNVTDEIRIHGFLSRIYICTHSCIWTCIMHRVHICFETKGICIFAILHVCMYTRNNAYPLPGMHKARPVPTVPAWPMPTTCQISAKRALFQIQL